MLDMLGTNRSLDPGPSNHLNTTTAVEIPPPPFAQRVTATSTVTRLVTARRVPCPNGAQIRLPLLPSTGLGAELSGLWLRRSDAIGGSGPTLVASVVPADGWLATSYTVALLSGNGWKAPPKLPYAVRDMLSLVQTRPKSRDMAPARDASPRLSLRNCEDGARRCLARPGLRLPA
ncbi:hypothetical protein BC567DRAFT_232074 [Phyllosticta citribraziliensis]